MIPIKKFQYRPDIDGLRALAILLVVLFHAFPTSIPGGYIGVDIFFVISGFLITGIILREFHANSFSFLEFYARRCRRIVPALLLVISSIWGIGWFALLPDEYSNLGKHLIAASTFTSNILLWSEAGYFDSAAELKPFLHLWSLGIEEQFYLLFPVVVGIAVYRKWNLLTVILILAVGSFIVNISLISGHAVATFYLLPGRFWELLIGAGLAYSEYQRHQGHYIVGDYSSGKSKHILNASSLLAISTIILAALFFNKSMLYPGWYALLPTLATAVVIYAGHTAWINRVALSSKLVVVLGLISFPLYLWHWPLLSLVRITGGGDKNFVMAGAVVSAILLAWLTWRLVELPLQRYFGKRKASASVLTAGAGLFIVVLVGFQTINLDGFKNRFPSNSTAYEQHGSVNWAKTENVDEKCSEHKWSVDFCRQTSDRPNIGLYGDSHANHLAPGFIALEDGSLNQLLHIGRSGCPPITGVRAHFLGSEDHCWDFNQQYSDFYLGFPSIKVVILSAALPLYLYGHTVGHQEELNMVIESAEAGGTADRYHLVLEGLSSTISAIEKSGRIAVMYLDVPELGFDPATCLSLQTRPFVIYPDTKDVCAVAVQEVNRRQAQSREIVSLLQERHKALKVFDPSRYLCDYRFCYSKKNGKMLYRDDNHLSVEGSKYLALQFKDWLEGEKVMTFTSK